MWTREELLPLARSHPEALVDIILAMQEQIFRLQKRVDELEARLAQNSRNSSKPPSSDGCKKPAPKSLRASSGKKTGGQPGHPGKTLAKTANPDRVVVHPVTACPCGADLSQTTARDYESRQVFDLPEPKLEVTEHRCEIKNCPSCGGRVTAFFPAEVTAPVQYGRRFKSLLVYLKDGQLMPLDRISQLCADLYGFDVSAATIEAARKDCHVLLDPFEEKLKEILIASNLLHADESGLRVKGKLHWIHSLSTELFTLYGVHEKRGREAMDACGVLPLFGGVLVHDFWKPYLTYLCAHALCNAHHLRELTFIGEELHQAWAGKMIELLVDMLECVRDQPPEATGLSRKEIAPWLKRYRSILKEGYETNPEPPVRTGKRGRLKRTKAQNLLERLDRHRKNVLAFLSDFRIPFSNNQAERDIRMIKVQQKISGGFRTMEGARMFASIRGYISTVRKHRLNVFEMITCALAGQPFLPSIPAR